MLCFSCGRNGLTCGLRRDTVPPVDPRIPATRASNVTIGTSLSALVRGRRRLRPAMLKGRRNQTFPL
jgi:hypothetical protein